MTGGWPKRGAAVLTVLGAVLTATGQPSVRLEPIRQRLYVHEPFEAVVEVRDFVDCQAPDFPQLSGCRVNALGIGSNSSQTIIINQRVQESRSRTYVYELIPEAEGELRIPAIPVVVDGQTLRTEPIVLQVYPSDADQLFFVEINTTRSRIYVGQRVEVVLTIWIRPTLAGGRRRDPSYMLRRVTPINLGPFPREISNPDNVGRYRIIDGQRELFYAYDFVTEFVASAPGPLRFDDIEIGMTYPTEFGNRNLRARPRVTDLQVLPVPQDGRPPHFNGAVGLFDIETSARPTDVRVGDPITLTIDIFGDGPLETLPPPLLSADDDLMASFRVPQEQLAGELVQGRRRFEVIIRAENDQVTEIPPIEYPYFDPDAERFVIARSDPIPLRVEAAAELAPLQLEELATALRSPPADSLQALDGLHDIETRETRLLARVRPVTMPLVAAILAVPPVVFGAACVTGLFVRQQAADPARKRRQRAGRIARERIRAARRESAATFGRDLQAALAGYLGDRLDQPAARCMGAGGTRALQERGAPEELAQHWQAITRRCEEMAFAGAPPADVEALCHDALAFIQALDRKRF